MVPPPHRPRGGIPTLRFPLPLVALTLALALASAAHTPRGRCDSGGLPALGIVEVSSGSSEETFYVDDRNFLLGNGTWVYQESNGIWTGQGPGVHAGDVTDHNVQRGGCSGFCLPEDSEICSDIGDFDPDNLIF